MGNELKDEEKIQAVQLILERRRISQDLLKAHFGSSERAIIVLTSLETDGFISKPEGSVRWEIHYDKIEKYLADQGIPLDKSEDNELDEQFDTVYQPNEKVQDDKNKLEFKISSGVYVFLSFLTGSISGAVATYFMKKDSDGFFLLSIVAGITIVLTLFVKSIYGENENAPFLCIGLAIIGFILFGMIAYY